MQGVGEDFALVSRNLENFFFAPISSDSSDSVCVEVYLEAKSLQGLNSKLSGAF